MPYDVLFLCSYYPNRLRSGGNFIERHALAVAQYANVSILTLEPDYLKDEPFELVYTLEHNDSLNIVRAYYNLNCINIPIVRSLIRFFRFIKAAWVGYQLLNKKTRKPQIVHLNVIRPLGIFALFLKYVEKLPFVLTEHSTAFLAENKDGMTFLEKQLTLRVLKAAETIMPVSVLLKNAIRKQFNITDSRFKVVSNVVLSDIFYPSTQNKFQDKIRFLHISNMKPFKNVEGIISVMAQLKRIRHDFELHIIGSGADLPSMKTLALKLGLLDNTIFFHPQKTENEIAEQMRLMDCFILFSYYETASMVVMESLCCGLPVIGTRVGVVPEVIENGKNGILINPADENALFEACLRMMNKIAEFKKPDNFTNYNMRFSAKNIGQQYNTIYKNVLD